MTTRVIEVEPERFDRWLAGFAERHGGYDSTEEHSPGGVIVHAAAADGSSIVATPFAHDPLGLVLVRRGGYAVGLAVGRTLRTAKVGSRHVQSRTAAGGWSQQRFARRRDKQADELVGAVVLQARRILLGDNESPPTGAAVDRAHPAKARPSGIPRGLVVGGDRGLVREVLEAPALRTLRGLPTRELYDMADPKRDVLEAALRRGRAYRVALNEPGTGPDDRSVGVGLS